MNTNNYESETPSRKREFFDGIRVEENLEMIYLKMKLENGEVRAIDLTYELQKIYDKEIEEKKNKIHKLKNIA